MDFTVPKRTELAVKLFRDFARDEIKPYVEEMDETEKMNMDVLAKLAGLGMFGIPIPKEYGGCGSDFLTNAICVEELSKVSATVAGVLSVQGSLMGPGLLEFGTQAQRETYLPAIASGKKIAAFSLTEPGAGSDAGGQQTTAVPDGDEYVINGTKIFCTNGGIADLFIVIAMTDRSKGHRGSSAFLVERGTPGFTVGKEEKKMGLRASSTTELIFENCRIPKTNLLGREGQGLKIALTLLDGGRLTIAAQAVGIAQGAIDETVKYVKERKQFGKRIIDFQNTQFKLVDMQIKTDLARLMVYKTAVLKDQKANYSKEAAMAKVAASEAAMDVTRWAVQLHGGYGYTREYPVEKMMRDAKITEIYEGANEIQRIVIANLLQYN